jgi:hypothetical protein
MYINHKDTLLLRDETLKVEVRQMKTELEKEKEFQKALKKNMEQVERYEAQVRREVIKNPEAVIQELAMARIDEDEEMGFHRW